MANVVISIDGQGTATYLVNEHTTGLFPEAARPRRASHVEPLSLWQAWAFRALRKACGNEGAVADWTRRWRCKWIVDCRPVGGPLHPQVFASRAEAIEFEINWLNRNWLGQY